MKTLKNSSLYFVENELIINLRAGKTKCILLGTSRKLSTLPNHMKLFYNHTQIYIAESHKYQPLTKPQTGI